MKIRINDKQEIQAVQKEFNTVFPYLKIEFFTIAHQPGAGTSKKNLIQHKTKTLGECRTIRNKGKINITPDMTVTELEQKFNKAYGLSVQVFRRSGKAWLETTVTDSWTLEAQNNHGEALTKHVIDKMGRGWQDSIS